MKSPYLALIWEQARTAGVLCAVIAGVTVLLQMNMLAMALTGQIFAYDAAATSVIGTFWALLLAAAMILVRQDGRGNLAIDFEPRLLHLPVLMLPTLFIVYSARILLLGGMGLFVLTTCRVVHGPIPDWGILTLALHIFVAAQTFIWIRHSITGLSYGLPALALAVALLLRYCFSDTVSAVSASESVQYVLKHPLSLLFSVPAFFMLSYLGVSWQRADASHGLPPLGSVVAALHEWRSARARRFISPLEAQLWFEQRRIGRLLPALTLFFTPVFVVLTTVAPNLLFDMENRYSNTPYAGLLAAALVCGRIGLRPRSRFPFHRPQTASVSAMAIVLMQIRALFFCFILVAALSFLGMLLEGYDGVVMMQMLRMGDLDWMDALSHVLRPAFFVTLIAWALLWVTTWPFFIPLAIFAIAYYLLPTLFYDSRFFIGAWISQADRWLFEKGFMLPVIMAIFWFTAVAVGLAVKRGLYRKRHLILGLVLFQNITLVLLITTPYLGTHRYAVVTCAAISALILLPLTAAPLSILYYRLKP